MAGGGYRPDSVPRGAASIHLGRASPRGSCSLPGNLTRQGGMRGQVPSIPLFGLAPHGVYRALSVSGEAVRSYRTLSPLPPFRLGGGLLSAALSLALPRPGVTRHAACHGVRTFLQGSRPSGRPPPPATARITLIRPRATAGGSFSPIVAGAKDPEYPRIQAWLSTQVTE